jgi:hypothetical protein
LHAVLASITEADVVGGTENPLLQLSNLFYRLAEHFGSDQSSEWDKKKEHETRVTVDEHEDMAGLL